VIARVDDYVPQFLFPEVTFIHAQNAVMESTLAEGSLAVVQVWRWDGERFCLQYMTGRQQGPEVACECIIELQGPYVVQCGCTVILVELSCQQDCTWKLARAEQKSNARKN
jgi:hypothetical protein